jgi:hypothetical protein
MTAAMRNPIVACRRIVGLLLAAVLTAGGAPNAIAAEAKPAATKPATAKKAAPKKAAAAKPVPTLKAMVEGEDVRDFRTFCDEWMGKLKDRTTYNTAHIPWTKGGAGVTGEYVSYGTERTCVAREEPGKDPIGKITYREIKYRKEGATEAAAMAGVGTIVEQTDVTEIFRYGKGRWQY